MLILNPKSVTFSGSRWADVIAVVVDRAAAREVVEWGDLGPHVVFADVPEQRVTIRVVREVARDDITAPSPGDSGTLSFSTAPTGADGGRRTISTDAVVLRVEHELSLKRGAVRTVTFVAVSADGAGDPFTVTDEQGAA